jgi:osmotically-inducible protein OsmY
MMRTDLGLRAAVSSAVRAHLGPAAAHVAVSVWDGIVTLSGRIATCSDKVTVEEAVQRVPGVLAVVEDLHVCTDAGAPVTDEALARAVLDTLAAGVRPIGRGVKIRLTKGWLTLTGSVGSPVEYLAVERALECVAGVRGVTNEVRIEENSAPCPAVTVAPPGL